jgi:nucleoside-diphosphate-sugar epimerase
MNKKILVTGGTGFIGSHFFDSLIEENHGVTVLDILE